MEQLIGLMSTNPARLYGLDAGYLAQGGPADIVLLDPGAEVVPGEYASRSSNTPFTGWRLRGRVGLTVRLLPQGRVHLCQCAVPDGSLLGKGEMVGCRLPMDGGALFFCLPPVFQHAVYRMASEGQGGKDHSLRQGGLL